MRVRPISLLMLGIAAGTAHAQSDPASEILVRTAEHGAFTRVVVDFTDRPTWRLGRADGAYELRTGQDTLRYDLSDVYRRVYAGRLVSIDAAGPGDLRLETGCDCTLVATERPNGGLIIDIRDGTPPEGNPYEVALQAPVAEPEPILTLPTVSLPVTQTLQAPGVLPVVADDEIRAAATQLGAGLAEEIARAATLDLVNLAPGVQADTVAAQGETAQMAPEPEAEPTADPEAPRRDGPNIRVVTEAERALTERGSLTSVDPSLCARFEKVLNPNDWVDPGLGPTGVQLDRRALFGLTGAADLRGFRNLVRGYLYLTFGREAAATLAVAPDGMVFKSLYAALANIVEDRPAGNNTLAGMTSCPGHTGLWARLADPEALAYRGDTTRVSAFSDWPPHLRRRLGPQLATAYFAVGDEETALGIFRALERVAQPEDPAFLLLAAQVAAKRNDDTAPPDAEKTVAGASVPESVGALIGLIQTRIEEGVPVGTDLAMQAGALAFELGGTPAASNLRAAEIAALVHDDLWRPAVARLGSGTDVADPGALWSDLVIAAAARADETDTLWLAARVRGNPQVSRTARLALADRIADLGLSAMARTALDLGAAIPNAEERRLLARLALLEDRPGVAEAHLAGLDTPADAALRAEIAEIRARQAQTPELPDPEPLPGAQIASAVEVTRQIPALPVVPSAGLESSRAVLGDAADLRNELEALLGSAGTR